MSHVSYALRKFKSHVSEEVPFFPVALHLGWFLMLNQNIAYDQVPLYSRKQNHLSNSVHNTSGKNNKSVGKL